MHAPARAALLLAPAAARLRAARRALARVSQLRASLRCTAASSAQMLVHQFPALGDNYGYLLHDEQTGATAAVDTPEARARRCRRKHP